MRKSISLALSLVGLFVSLYLLWVYTSPSSPMVCFGGGCDVARASSYSHLLGIPLPVFGIVMYAFLLLLLFIHALLPVSAARWTEYAVVLVAGGGFLSSLYLTGVEAFVLHAWCEWCVTSALAVTGVFVLSLVDISKPGSPFEASEALKEVQRNFALILFAFVLAVPSFVLLTRHGSFPASKPPSAKTVEAHLVRPDTHFYGDPHARVTVVEFGDFQCPACRQAEETARKIRQKYGDRIRFAFRQFPLQVLHAHSEKAAEASECAAQQGKFWQAVDKFYANQDDLSMPALSRYASELGLNSREFVGCLQKGQMASRVAQDIEDGRALGVHATPTFFIDGKMIVGPIQYSQFTQLITNELQSKESEQADATPPSSSALTAKQTTESTPAGKKSAAGKMPTSQASETMQVLGAGSQNLLAAAQNSATACSEAEAKKRQPTMIRTAQAKALSKDASHALFVDVRSAKNYRSGHIPGAINLPIDNFEQEWRQLPKDKTIVLYESGRSSGDICAASRAAGRILLAQGFGADDVKVYQDGLASWQKAGLPLKR
ncbi:MAG TPA: thioredoxin domain-containing protein [Terriglobia bacterium]|nr:thioredoxin domain-containing protein [Terriglobia bacterium]